MKINGLKFVFALFVSLVLASCSKEDEQVPGEARQVGSYERIDGGVLIRPAEGEAKVLRLLPMREDVIRVSSSPLDSLDNIPQSIMVVAQPQAVNFDLQKNGNELTLTTKAISAKVNLVSGQLNFFDAAGKPLLSTAHSGKFAKVTADPSPVDEDSFAISQSFLRTEGEAYYGLGQHQNGQVNLADENVYLTTHNLVITIPYLVSSNNYGILWDNNSDSLYGKTTPASALGEELNLYNAAGEPGGLTARYFDGDTLLLERVEADMDYQFLSNNSIREYPMPEETKDAKNLRIELEGSIEPKVSGKHELIMYSSGYAKLFLGGELKLDRWRMNWNPWFHNVKVDLNKGEKTALKLEWTPQGGYMRLQHHAPAPETWGELMSLSSETAKAIDYYVVAGENKDELISGYRYLTGKSVMLPRWAYGFWQSRERYKSSDEIITALKKYRDLEIPIDNIVLDWSYWPVDAWGSHDFDKEFFPDPKALVDTVHDMNAQIMISVWPKFYPTTENYKELNAKGYMLNRNIEEGNLDWIYPGYLNAFYDAYNPGARDMYWKQLHEKINVYGFDAWWLDAVEPDMHSNVSWRKRKEFMTPNYLGNGAEVFNAYAVPHAESVYKHDRASAPDTRVFILTRSGFGGIQRTASAIWSGDIVSRWSNMKEQIAAGIGTGLAGMPNWTLDIGGFTPEDRYRSNNGKFVGTWEEMAASEVDEWQELNTRWFQFGAFLPMFRSHGQNPYREIYNIAPQGSEEYESMVWYTKLRYRLLPYIYAQAGDMYHRDGTLMRGLAMDFPQDKTAADTNDQYMFGPALLVSPVYEFKARSRSVYLPEADGWYDFYSGEKYDGGMTVDAQAPLGLMPLYVKAGSIIPTGPAIQHSDQLLNADITVTVYTGANGEFSLYEDDGRSYGYENGEWSRIPLSYDHEKGELTVGARIGSFPGMTRERKIHVRWISGETEGASDFDKGIATTIDYNGELVVIKR